MELTLPMCGAKIKMHDYVPQDVLENSEIAQSSGIQVDASKAMAADLDSIATELGADRAKEILDAKNPRDKKELMGKARMDIAHKHINAKLTTKDAFRGMRVKVLGMILEWIDKDGNELGEQEIKKAVGLLHRKDYDALVEAIEEVEERDEADGKT